MLTAIGTSRKSVGQILASVALMALLLAVAAPVGACPFCVPSDTLSNQIYNSDAAVIVSRISGEEGEEGAFGTTLVRIERVLHISPALAKASVDESAAGVVKTPAVGDEVLVSRYYPPQKEMRYLLRGADPENFQWGDNLVEMSDELLKYVLQAPPPDVDPIKRAKYFLQFFEAENGEIASDAYGEFASIPYEAVVDLRERLPREKLRRWLFDDQVPGTRIGLYGMMLGLCGEKEDAALLEKKILEREREFRLGIDGVIGGYLLLTGDAGMDLLSAKVLEPDATPKGEVMSAMQAMRFMWTYGEDRVQKKKLRDAMRLLIDKPDHMDMAVRDLARWEDWSDMDQVVALYGTENYDDTTAKLAIVKYLLAAEKYEPEKPSQEALDIKAAAQKHLDTLRERDPKLVQRAERFFDLN